MRLSKLNKTQFKMLELIINRPHFTKDPKCVFGTSSEGYPMMRVQNGNWIQQCCTLAEKFPWIVKAEFDDNFSTVQLNLLDDEKARELLDYNLGWYAA